MSGGSSNPFQTSTSQQGTAGNTYAGLTGSETHSDLSQAMNSLMQQSLQQQQTGSQTGTSGSQTGFNTQNTATTGGQSAQAGQVGPWGAAAGNLTDILAGLKAQYGNVNLNPTEMAAFGQLSQNAQNTPNWAPQVQNVASGLLGGDPTGLLGSALNAYKTALNPIATGSLDPRTNPGTADLLASVRNDVQNSVNGQFAGAGRDLSGLNQQYLARGITGAEAPILLNQYNANVANRMGAAGNLFGAAGTTAGAMGGNQQNAFNVIPMVEQLRNAGPSAQLAIESAKRNAPVGALGQLAGITAPIAGLGQTTAQTGQQVGTTAGGQTGTSATNAFTNMLNQLLTNTSGTQSAQQNANQNTNNYLAGSNSGYNYGQSVGGGTSTPSVGQDILQTALIGSLLFSDVRLKENVQKVGRLFNGLNVYTFRYKGSPTTHMGVLAQEVEKVHPEAVGEIGGYKAVDYEKAVQ